MRLLSMLGALTLGTVLALAQQTTTTITTTMDTGPVAIAGETCQPILSADTGACPMVATPAIAGRPILLVLGSEETLPLDELPVQNVNWRDAWTNFPSLLNPENPLTSNRPNFFVVRHGNPYFPYYQVAHTPQAVRVAGAVERVTTPLPTTLTTEQRDTLSAVTTRYRGMTRAQAQALGYEPVGACIEGVGQVYVNQALVDNTFDPMQPEAFTYSPDGNLLAAHYIIVTDQQMTLFGQRTSPSPLVQNAQQLSVWLYTNNPNGTFAMRSTENYCPRPAGPREVPRPY